MFEYKLKNTLQINLIINLLGMTHFYNCVCANDALISLTERSLPDECSVLDQDSHNTYVTAHKDLNYGQICIYRS